MSADRPALEATDLTRTHTVGRVETHSLERVSLTVGAGEVVAVTGPSGSGKTTLLHLCGGLDNPDRGSVRVSGVDWSTLSGPERAEFRRRAVAFVVQGFGLLPQATAAENVEVPLVLKGVAPGERRTLVAESLQRVGLSASAPKLPDQLSGGEQQRVAIARMLVQQPTLILADEPTGNLDSTTAKEVSELLLAAARERNTGVLLVTHDPALAGQADRVIRLSSGHVVGGDAGRSSPDGAS